MKQSGYQQKEKQRSWLNGLGMALLVGLFFVIKLGLIYYHDSPVDQVRFLGFLYDIPTVCGLLTEAHVMILVCLVVCFQRKGYWISQVLCLLTVASHLAPLLWGGHIISVIGMIMTAGAGCIDIIIYHYIQKLNTEKNKYHHLSVYDSLTDLVNRRMILQVLEGLTQQKNGRPFAIVFIDLDDFKKVNDFTGHDQGDLLLQQVAAQWKKVIRKGDLLGRLGGDEFALIIQGQMTQEEIRSYLEKLRNSIRGALVIGEKKLPVTACFGVAAYPTNSQNYEDLLKYADTAMYVAKAHGKDGTAFFTDDMYAQLTRRRKIEEGLDKAIENNEFYLVYQPQYHCHTTVLRGFEVLLRWQSPVLGSVSPGEFIPIAEEKGSLIIRIGSWVLETACRRFMALTGGNTKGLTLSVNVSSIQFLDDQFIQYVQTVIEKTGIDPHCLEFEITESIFISSKESIIAQLTQLRQMGIKIALDDFGTQYASLSYIQQLPLDTIKIDKSFIDGIGQTDETLHLVTSIIHIAQKLHYKVVAEGIEKDLQVQFLDQNGCDYIQGFLWGRPMAEADIRQLLEKRS